MPARQPQWGESRAAHGRAQEGWKNTFSGSCTSKGGHEKKGGVDFIDIVGQRQSEGNSPSHWLFTGPLMEGTGLIGPAGCLSLLHRGGSRRLSLLFPLKRHPHFVHTDYRGWIQEKPEHLTCFSVLFPSPASALFSPSFLFFRPRSHSFISMRLLCFVYFSTVFSRFPSFLQLCHSVFQFCHWLDEPCLEKPQPVSSWKDCQGNRHTHVTFPFPFFNCTLCSLIFFFPVLLQ